MTTTPNCPACRSSNTRVEQEPAVLRCYSCAGETPVEAFEIESPEQHTARVLASLDAWLRSTPGNIVEIAYKAGECQALACNTSAWNVLASVRDNTFIGALANLLSALQEPPAARDVDEAIDMKEWGF